MNAEEVTKKIDLHLHRASESVYQSNQEGHLAHANTYIAYLQALNTGVRPAGNGNPDHIDYAIDPEPWIGYDNVRWKCCGARREFRPREGYSQDPEDYKSNQEGHLAHANTIGEKEDPKLPLDPEPYEDEVCGVRSSKRLSMLSFFNPRDGYSQDPKDYK